MKISVNVTCPKCKKTYITYVDSPEGESVDSCMYCSNVFDIYWKVIISTKKIIEPELKGEIKIDMGSII